MQWGNDLRLLSNKLRIFSNKLRIFSRNQNELVSKCLSSFCNVFSIILLLTCHFLDWNALFSSCLSSRLFCLSSAPSKRDEYGEYSELSQQAFPSSASSSPPYTKTSTQFAGLSKRPRKGYSSSLDKELHK